MGDNWRSTWWGLIIGTIIRHGITSIGAVLLAHGWLDEKAHHALTSHEDVVIGATLMLLAFAWAAASKTKALAWVRAALHLDRRATLIDVKRDAAAAKPAAKVPLVLAAAVLACSLTVTGCKTAASDFDGWYTQAQKIANADSATKYYLMASDVYSTLMRSLVSLRSAHKIDDATWQQVERFRDTIGVRGEQAGVLLQLWRKTKQKPADFDASYNDTVAQLQALQDLYGGLR